jgi:hypothetical protein
MTNETLLRRLQVFDTGKVYQSLRSELREPPYIESQSWFSYLWKGRPRKENEGIYAGYFTKVPINSLLRCQIIAPPNDFQDYIRNATFEGDVTDYMASSIPSQLTMYPPAAHYGAARTLDIARTLIRSGGALEVMLMLADVGPTDVEDISSAMEGQLTLATFAELIKSELVSIENNAIALSDTGTLIVNKLRQQCLRVGNQTDA